jgi:hypothetical protein
MTKKLHPWEGFLTARWECIKWFKDIENKSNREIAHLLSVDEVQVEAIIEAHRFLDGEIKMK